MHVVASGASLAVSTLKKEDLLGDTGGDGSGQATLPSRDSGETTDICPASPEDAAQGVAEHLVGDRVVGRDWVTVGPVSET